MKAILVILLFQTLPTTYPIPEESAVFGPSGSLLGVVRPSGYFYPLHPCLQAYIHPYDRRMLSDRYRLEKHLVAAKHLVKHSDTFYVNIPKSEFIRKFPCHE